MESCTIAVDVMGGDNAPAVVVDGIRAALAQDAALSVLAVGQPDALAALQAALAGQGGESGESKEGAGAALAARCTFAEASQVITMEEHPANAVRTKRDSSVVVGCKAVKEHRADGFYSAGSTGAVLVGATLHMGRIKGVSRPMLGTMLPSATGPVLFCDIGANADCKPEYLVQFGFMGKAYMRAVFGVAEPVVGLLNIGEEDTKGSAFAQETNALLRAQLPGFAGNAQGKDLLAGGFDVVVTDGFTGNVCLKALEGAVKMLFGSIKTALFSSVKAKLGALLVKDKLRGLKDDLNPDKYGGAPLIGVAGACVIGHGNSNAEAIKNGILMTAKIARSKTGEVIAEALAKELGVAAPASAAASATPAPAASPAPAAAAPSPAVLAAHATPATEGGPCA